MPKELKGLEAAIDKVFSAEDTVDFDLPDWIAFSGVTFKKDFGPWKEGDKVENINVDFSKGEIQESDEEGNPNGKSCSIGLEIILL